MSANRNPSPKYGVRIQAPTAPTSAGDSFSSESDAVNPVKAVFAGSSRLQNASPHSHSHSPSASPLPLYRQASPSSALASAAYSSSSANPTNKSPGAGVNRMSSPFSNNNRAPTPTQTSGNTNSKRLSNSASRALKLANLVREVCDPKLLTTKLSGETRSISRRKQRKLDNKDLKYVFQVLSRKGSRSGGGKEDIEGRWIDEIMSMDRSQLLGIISSSEVNFSTVLGALFDDKSNADILNSFRKCEEVKFGLVSGPKKNNRYRRTHGIIVSEGDRVEIDGADITEKAWMNIERKLRHMIIDLIKQNPASMLEIICVIESIIYQFYRVIFSIPHTTEASVAEASTFEASTNEADVPISVSSISLSESVAAESSTSPDSAPQVTDQAIDTNKLVITNYGNPISASFIELSTDHPDDPDNCIRVTTKCPRNRVLFHGLAQFYGIYSETIVNSEAEKVVRLQFKEKTKTVETLSHNILLSNVLLQWVRKNNTSKSSNN